MKVSVALATYNGERYLEDQLLSIFRQTRIPDQIVISDDHSIDRTDSIITKCINDAGRNIPEIIYIKNDRDKGLSGNFENALEKCTGDYIFLCDQDDVWFSDKIEYMLKVAGETMGDIIYSNARLLIENRDGFTKTDICLFDGNSESFSLITKQAISNLPIGEICLIQGMCLCIKREFLKSALPISRGCIHDLWIESCGLVSGKVVRIEKCLAYYRIHRDNLIGISAYNKNGIRKIGRKIRNHTSDTFRDIINQCTFWRDFRNYTDSNVHGLLPRDITPIIKFYTEDRIRCLLSSPRRQSIGEILEFYNEHLSTNYSFSLMVRDLMLITLFPRSYVRSSLGNRLKDLI